jgi:poly-gamma-glutamate synthesis protein (capsule biosynthesis protein)
VERPGEVVLLVGGDLTLGANLQTYLDQRIAQGEKAEDLYPLFLKGVQPLFGQADLVMVNLEGTFTGSQDRVPKNFNFKARPELVQVLTEGGVDLVSLGNNHVMDYGPAGLDETLSTLDQAGIPHFGAGHDLAEARVPVLLERNGVKLAFLAYYVQTAEDGLEPDGLHALADKPGAAGAYRDPEAVKRMVAQDLDALQGYVDAPIVFFHWGREGHHEVMPYQAELARLAVDHGARAVLGAHPHVLQGAETYKGAPIFYSLGNFVFGGKWNPADPTSVLARLRILRDGTVEAGAVPLRITDYPEAPFQPRPLAGAEAKAVLGALKDYSAGLKAPMGLD